MKRIEKAKKNIRNHNIFPFFWLHGESKEILIDYIHKVYESSISSICIESRPHPDFLGDKWWEDLDILLSEAKKLNMSVWILDDAHFPTGYANGAIKNKYPEKRKSLLTHRKVNVLGPQKSVGVHTIYLQDMEAKLLSIYAKQDESIIDLSDKIGQDIVYFEVPAGQWDVYMIYETKKSEYNPDYINFIDKESCNILLETVYEPHYARYKEYFGSTIKGFFSDEPGFMNEKGVNNDSAIGKLMPLPWSAELSCELKNRLGQDYLTKLDGLWYDTSSSSQIRYTFMDLCTQLYRKNFSENIGTWCRNKGVSYIGHVIEDRDSNARLGVGAGHIFRAMAGQDMAGVDIVLNQLIPGMDEGMHQTIRGTWDNEFFHYLLAKLGSSIAQIDTKKMYRTMAEVYGAYGWHEGTQLMKWITDHFLIRGVNHFVPHAFSLKEFPDYDCPPHFYAHGNNPQFQSFKVLMAYLNRMTTLLDGMSVVPTAAVLYHAEAEWTGDYMLTQKVTKTLTQHQIEFNVIPNDVFSESENYKTRWDKRLQINGCEYPVLIFPESSHIHPSTAKMILEHACKETKVIFINRLPKYLMTGGDTYLIDQLMTNEFVDIVKDEDLGEYLLENGYYETRINQPLRYLRYGSFTSDTMRIKMFFNEDPKNEVSFEIVEGLPKANVYKYDVMNNIITKSIKPFVKLAPYESIVFIEDEVPADLQSSSSQELLKHERKLGLPNRITFSTENEMSEVLLNEYSNLSEKNLFPEKSGSFTYYYCFVMEESCPKARLEIEEGYESIQVVVNGIKTPLKICPPYRFILPEGLRKGENSIEIIVTNTLDKKIPDYFSFGEAVQPTGILSEPQIIY
ncbi:hypothetical protein IGK30_003580 [Enterococcus sp. AZ178]|uniref:hypothetical protein n=1 Tax=Enterococcus sp. AZ178 TaxID=2774822 RepID=UPI003F281001